MRYRRIISALLIPVMLAQFTGCTKWTWVGPAKLQPEESTVRAIEYLDARVADHYEEQPRTGVRHTVTAYFYDEPPAALERDTLYVALPDGPYALALGQVERVEVRRPDNEKNINIAISVLVIGILVALAASGDLDSGWNY
jgi:hypothetical protein